MYESTEGIVEEMIDLELRKEEEVERESESTSQFAKFYKARNFLTQEERRQKYLQRIKLRRSQSIDKMRGLEDILSEEFDADYMLEELEIPEEPMEVEIQRRRKKKKILCEKLMLSEWLLERPSEFKENWVVKLCPIGKRCLIVAHNGKTIMYDKYKKYIQTFSSNFPGGNKTYCSQFTVLDCIFNKEKQCYFVIDLLAWKGISFRDADVECRNFWLTSKFAETEELEFTSIQHNYPFYYVESFSVDELENRLSIPYNINGDCSIKLDGILFYVKDVPYIMRITPLVGWLKPFMVREILGIDVDESFQTAPPNYTVMREYLAQLKEKKKQLSVNRKRKCQC